MADPPDDRLTLEQQLSIAADARYSGFFTRRKFRRVFHPHRVLALLHRVEDSDRALHILEKEWREQCAQLEARITRAQALTSKWRGMTPDIDNGWADDLEEALGDAKPEPEPTPVLVEVPLEPK